MARRAVTTSTTHYRPAPSRQYAGLEASERRAQRRARLVEAAHDLFASQGYASTTIQHLVDRAGGALRTFYEEFGTREALLTEVYDLVVDSLFEGILATVRASGPSLSDAVRATVDYYVRAFTLDLAKTKIALIEVIAVSPTLEKHRRVRLKAFIRELAIALQVDSSDPERIEDFGLTMIAVSGASERLIAEWVLSKGRLPTRKIAEKLYPLWLSALGQHFAPTERHATR